MIGGRFMRKFWLAMAMVSAIAAPAAAAGLCGSRDDYLAKMAMLAFAAHTFCPGVDEISDDDLGRLVLAAGISKRTFTGDACQRDVAIANLALKAEYEKDRGGWCNDARKLMADNPLTKPLVKRSSTGADCNEVDKGAGMVTAIVKHCPGYKATDAGSAVISMGKSMCVAGYMTGVDIGLQKLAASAGGSRSRAVTEWCKTTITDLDRQLDGVGLPHWVGR